MNHILKQNHFIIKEHIGLLKAANNYDILEPDSGKTILECREHNLKTLTKMARFTNYKMATTFDIKIQSPQGEQVLRLKRGKRFLFLSSVIEVLDENDKYLGGFKQKFFPIDRFKILNSANLAIGDLCSNKNYKNSVALVTGLPRWVAQNPHEKYYFSFIVGNKELARVHKKWAGLAKEVMTTADEYILKISPKLEADNPIRKLIIASAMCIDMTVEEWV